MIYEKQGNHSGTCITYDGRNIVAVARYSCTKNDDNTIALIGTEDYIDDILSLIPDSLQTRFLAEFGSIPEGFTPPKIEGSYVMDPKLRVSSNVDGWPLQPHLRWAHSPR